MGRATFAVTVQGAAAQLTALRDVVTAHAPLSTAPARVTLLADLAAAGTDLAAARRTAFCTDVNAFVTHTKAATAPRGPLTAAVSTDWQTRVRRIATVGGC